MTIDQLSATFGLLSVLALAWPAIHAASFARRVHKLNRIGHLDRHGADKETFRELLQSLQRLKDKWTPTMNFTFLAGTALAVLAAALSVLDAYVGKSVGS